MNAALAMVRAGQQAQDEQRRLAHRKMSCGCGPGMVRCPRQQRLAALRLQAYKDRDWAAWEQSQRALLAHLDIMVPA